LQWTTASEINNAFFVVERADQDPRHFAAIAQIPGQGNSTSNTRYEFIDDRIIPGMSYCYRLTDTNFDGNQFQHEPIQIQYVTDYLPTEVHLLQNFPNPFNLSTFISYELPTESAVEISVFDLGGKLIKTLVDGVESPGLKTVRWDGRDDTGQIVSSGTYYFRMNANGTAKYGRALLLK